LEKLENKILRIDVWIDLKGLKIASGYQTFSLPLVCDPFRTLHGNVGIFG